MITALLTSIVTFIATGIDEIVVLTILFVHYKKQKSIREIYIGQQISMIVLLGISLLAVFGIAFFPKEYVGILGLAPIAIGLRILVTGDTETDEYDKEKVIRRSGKFDNLTLGVALIAIAGGSEELSLYIPYLASLDKTSLVITLIMFNLLVPVWCSLCLRLSSIIHIQKKIEKYERITVPVLFIGLGIFVLIENGTLNFIF